MSVIDYGKVARDAALRKGAVIHKDYAGMLPAVILNVMLESMSAAVAAALEVCRDGHAESVRRWRRDGAAKVERILGAALGMNRGAASQTIGDGADKAAGMARGILAGPVLLQKQELGSVVTGVRRYALLALAAHGILFVTAVAVLFF